MVQKYRNQLLLFLKIAFFGIALLLVPLGNWNIVFFAAVASFLYTRPLFGNYQTKYAFIILLVTSIIGVNTAANSALFLPAVVVFSFVFYLLLGIKDYLFVKRSRIYYAAALILLEIIFLLFFLSNKSEFFFLKYGAIMTASFFIFKEWLSLISAFHFLKREFIASLAAVFIIAELLWGIALLPIGFINASSLLLLCVFLLGEFLYRHFIGNISKAFLLQSSIIFLFISLVIFLTSRWG